MSMNGKIFRPPPQNNNSALFDSSDDDDASVSSEKQAPPSSSKKSSNANLSESESEASAAASSASEDESDDDAPAPSKKRGASSSSSSKPSKKQKAPNFFDEEAEDVGSDDESVYGAHYDPHDVVKKHYTEEDIRRENMDEEAAAIMRQQDLRRQRAALGFDPGRSAAEVAKEIEERHRMANRTVDRRTMMENEGQGGRGGMAGEQSYGTVSQQSLVPSVSDPSLWMFGCTPGKEQDLVFQIMNKCVAMARQGKPLGITACIAAQTKGKIYLESYSEPAVIEATRGVRNLMAYSMRVVPINDMTTVLTVVPTKKPVKKNDWVRMTRGHYKGDLALVKFVKDSGLRAVIQCVPRIDLTLADLPPEEAKIRRKTIRPPQKLFNASEVVSLGKEPGRQRLPGADIACDYFEGNYYHDGYLLKEVTVGNMIRSCGEDEMPTIDELQLFTKQNRRNDYDDGEDEDNEREQAVRPLLDRMMELQGKTRLAGSDTNDAAGLVIGDTVEVVEGDLVGMRGKLLALDGTTVKIKPSSTDLGLTTEVEFLASQVRKYIAEGAHVKVISGHYSNETGTVVAVDSSDAMPTAVVLTDLTHKEIKVRVSQLQESAEVAAGQDKLAGYELHDLVVLSGGGNNEVGVIVRVGREEFSVINNHGVVRDVRPEELRGKKNSFSQRAMALDAQGNQIKCGDSVSVAEGPHKGKTASIKRLSRSMLFLYQQTRTDHAGIFVVRSRSCVMSGSQKGGRGDRGAPVGLRTVGRGGGRGMRGRSDDGLVGKTVRIQSGTWKGYLGVVTDSTSTHVEVELHSRLKKVKVIRERVAVVGDKFGATENPNRENETTAIGAPSTPFLGGATPMHGVATPMHDVGGGFTPSHSGGHDDVWRPGGSIDRTPLDDDTAKTETSTPWGSTADNNEDRETESFLSSTTENTGGGWTTSSPEQTSTWTPSTNNKPTSPQHTSTANNITAPPSPSLADSSDNTAPPVWFMERVCVQITKSNQSGSIKEIHSNKSASIELDDKSSTVQCRPSEVALIQPKEHDMVLVTGGADVGVEGELVCIDGTDAILKDGNEDFKIVEFTHLAKIVNDS